MERQSDWRRGGGWDGKIKKKREKRERERGHDRAEFGGYEAAMKTEPRRREPN